ncbi:hypothetical protein [Microbacterium sp. NPDC076895]|uniref:hypothetical protein n=1 Tax=Microbacterium sp. NPDC076895 TaxID=3154957 RepID=UPI00343C8FA1
MSSSDSEHRGHDPADQTPEQRRERWDAEAERRHRIHHGLHEYGEEQFLAFLQLPETNPDDPELLDKFAMYFVESFSDPIRVALRFVGSTFTGEEAARFIVGVDRRRGTVTVDVTRAVEHIRDHYRLVRMGDRTHVFEQPVEEPRQ